MKALTSSPKLSHQSFGSHAQVPANRCDRVERDGVRAADRVVGEELLSCDVRDHGKTKFIRIRPFISLRADSTITSYYIKFR